jgi:N-acetylmuramoyl-L-alanine amidase
MGRMHRLRLLVLALAVAFTAAPATAGRARAVEPAVLPLAGIVIALDPGHNGGNASHRAAARKLVFVGNGRKACNTTGTATRSGYAEHRFTFNVAKRVRARLEALGAKVFLTRASDHGVGPCVDRRGRFGAKVHARLLVSIHADGSGASHRGFVVMKPGLVRGYTDDILASSATLARAMRRGLLATGLPIANYYAKNGIKKRTDLGTLNMSDVPAVMVELGNMKNASDARRMTTKGGRSAYAAGLVAGIRDYLGR